MEEKVEDYYIKYKEINAIKKEKIEQKNKVISSLVKSKAGKLYFSLNDEQKELFESIYRDVDFSRYLYLRDNVEEYEKILDELESKILSHEEFPFQNIGPAIYITDSVDTYNALTDENTKDVNAANKEVIKEVIFNNYGFESEFEVSDIPLIKVIYDKINKYEIDYPNGLANWIIEDNILKQVEKIHQLDKKHITYKENRRPFIADLKEKIKENETEIINSDSGFKYLLLFLVNTAKYEVSLLEGKRVTALLKEIEESNMNESDKDYFKDALVKAYFNLTNIEFRKQSKYFDNDNDIWYATFETANPEINKRLIKMRQG